EEAGVALPALPDRSWTIDEFMQAAEALTMDRDGDGNTDVYALTFAARDTENMLAWLFRFGGRLMNEDGTEFVLNSPEGVRALQLVVGLIYEYGYAPPGGEALDVYGTIENLHNARAAMGYGGIYEIGRIDRYLNEGRMPDAINVVLAPFPHDPVAGPVAYETSGGFLVFKQDDEYRREMAMELARFLTNKENIKMLESLLYITARRSANAEVFGRRGARSASWLGRPTWLAGPLEPARRWRGPDLMVGAAARVGTSSAGGQAVCGAYCSSRHNPYCSLPSSWCRSSSHSR